MPLIFEELLYVRQKNYVNTKLELALKYIAIPPF